MNSNAISQERISWIDTAKGFGIIAIILGHLGTGSLGEWFYTFHVPLFFFILVPYLALGIPMLVFDTILTEKSFASLCTGFLLQQRQWTIWFLTVLFLLNVTFYGCIKIFPKLLIVGVVSILASVCGFLYCKMGG